MSRDYEPPEPVQPGKQREHDRDDSRQEREKDYVKQVQHNGRQHQQESGRRGRQQH